MQGRLVGPNGLAEWTQREIWPEIATLYASNGRNLAQFTSTHPLSVPASSDTSKCVETDPPGLVVWVSSFERLLAPQKVFRPLKAKRFL